MMTPTQKKMLRRLALRGPGYGLERGEDSLPLLGNRQAGTVANAWRRTTRALQDQGFVTFTDHYRNYAVITSAGRAAVTDKWV